MAKGKNESPVGEPAQPSGGDVERIDSLARDIYLHTVSSPNSDGLTPDHHADRAIEKAEAFFRKLKSRLQKE